MSPTRSTADPLEDRILWARLTPKEVDFLHAYLTGHDEAAAYRQVFGEDSAARHKGRRVLRRPIVASILGAVYLRRTAAVDITQEAVLRELAKIAFSDVREYLDDFGQLLPIHEIGDNAAGALSSIEIDKDDGSGIKVKLWDKLAALKEIATLCGWRVQKTEDVSKGGTFIVKGLDVDGPDPLYS